MKIIYSNQKKKLLEKLKKYNIDNLDFILIETGTEKIRGYTGDLTPEQLINLNKKIPILLTGLYLFHEYLDDVRLSTDAAHILKNQIKDNPNIIKLNEDQMQRWFKGEDLEVFELKSLNPDIEKQEKTFKIIQYQEDFIGSGKLTFERLVNYVPKERRIKQKQ